MRFLTLLLSVVALFSCGEKHQFVLNGTVKGVASDKIVVSTFDRSGESTVMDTINVVDGKFTYSKLSIKTGNYSLKLIGANATMGSLLENGILSITADLSTAQRGYIQKVKLTGSKNQDLINRFHGMKAEILALDKYAACKEVADQLKNVKDHDEYVTLNDKLNKLAPNLEKEMKDAKLDLLRTNIKSYFAKSVFPFLKQVASNDEIKELYNLLPEDSKNDPSVMSVKKDIEAKERIQVGKIAPNFTLETPEGKNLSLFDLKGQVVLVDFWASWCKPCRASFPHMKELYKKYHSKGFEILGVTNDSNHKAWKKAIKNDEIPWLNVADEFPVNPAPARVISEYGMDYLPSTVLIDREGVIIAKLLHGHELDDKLKEIFGE